MVLKGFKGWIRKYTLLLSIHSNKLVKISDLLIYFTNAWKSAQDSRRTQDTSGLNCQLSGYWVTCIDNYLTHFTQTIASGLSCRQLNGITEGNGTSFNVKGNEPQVMGLHCIWVKCLDRSLVQDVVVSTLRMDIFSLNCENIKLYDTFTNQF